MNNKMGLQGQIEAFFDQIKLDSHDLFDHTFFVCRSDGGILYFHKSGSAEVNKNSIGALVGGLWQAGRTVVDIFDKNDGSIDFRLSFDTASTGIHILPFQLGKDEYFIGLYFNKIINPALLKNKMKQVLIRLHHHLDFDEGDEDSTEIANGANLFQNITDEEMDNLFSFAEN